VVALKKLLALALAMSLLALAGLMLALATEAGSRLATLFAAVIVGVAVAVPVGLALAMLARPVARHYHLHVEQPLNVQRTTIERVEAAQSMMTPAADPGRRRLA
jgi:hypothetical protein